MFKNKTLQMKKTNIGLILIIVSALSIQIYLVGNHGRLMFRANMTEDWIIWGIAVSACVAGIYLLIGKTQKTKRLL